MTDLISATFQFQRTAVEQTHAATVDAIEASTEAMTATSQALEETETFTESAASLTRQSWHAYFDALEANLPEGAADFDRFRAFVDDTLDSSIESQEEFNAALAETLDESGTAFESFADNYTEMVDETFEAALEAHAEAESAFTDAAEEIEITE